MRNETAPAHAVMEGKGAYKELAHTAVIRAGRTCHADIAKAVGKYMSSYKVDRWCLHAITLDRSLAAACAW